MVDWPDDDQATRTRLTAEAEHAKYETQVQQLQHLESLGQLAGGVAHDLNNVLAVVLNYSTFVAEEVAAEAARAPGERWEGVLRDLVQIRRAAERAASLTAQLSGFGRRELVRARPGNLNDLVSGSEATLRQAIGGHVALDTSLASGLWDVVVDPAQIEEVLVSLAVNARDSMPSGGILTVETSNVDVDETYAAQQPGLNAGAYVRLRVSDTGVGMEKAVLDRAFEPFFTTKPRGQGRGLGLAIVYGVIAEAGGRVRVYSEPGIGTTLSVLLPAAVDGPVGLANVEHRRAGEGETVLVVENEDDVREVTRRILARHGYTVLEASSGEDAVKLAGGYDGEISLMLTDVVMGRMPGREVAQWVRQVRAGTRVLYMSGYPRSVLRSQGRLDHGDPLVEKPFSEAGLLEMVEQVLHRRD